MKRFAIDRFLHAIAWLLFIISCCLAYGGQKENKKITRLKQIRQAGNTTDAPVVVLDKIKIDDDDYLLMGADNTCAKRNHPDLEPDVREQGRWYAASKNLTHRPWNSHSHTDSETGETVIETFYTTIPRERYQADPAEVVWHYYRVLELRAAGIGTQERIAIIKKEAKEKPWLNHGEQK